MVQGRWVDHSVTLLIQNLQFSKVLLYSHSHPHLQSQLMTSPFETLKQRFKALGAELTPEIRDRAKHFLRD